MMKTILMLIIPIMAFLGGAAAGDYLRAPDMIAVPQDGGDPAEPAEPPAHTVAPPSPKAHGSSPASAASKPDGMSWFQFPQQFFVPIMRSSRLDSTMVLSLSVEMPAGATESVYAQEIRLRDALLRQLLIHANTGGFDGNFTAEAHLRAMRQDLLKAVQALAPEITAVLIGDIARQDAG